jgi:hypothetical protein
MRRNERWRETLHDLCVAHMKYYAILTKEIYGKKTTSRDCDKTTGARAPPWHLCALWMAYRAVRTVTTLEGLCQLLLTIRRCHNPACERYHHSYRPEEEGRWALPHGEFGLDIITLVGALRYEMHRSVPEIHQALCKRGVVIADRTQTP